MDSTAESRIDRRGDVGRVRFRRKIVPIIFGSTVEAGTPGHGSTAESRDRPKPGGGCGR
jgi:hypothetical protein